MSRGHKIYHSSASSEWYILSIDFSTMFLKTWGLIHVTVIFKHSPRTNIHWINKPPWQRQEAALNYLQKYTYLEGNLTIGPLENSSNKFFLVHRKSLVVTLDTMLALEFALNLNPFIFYVERAFNSIRCPQTSHGYSCSRGSFGQSSCYYSSGIQLWVLLLSFLPQQLA